MQAAIAAGQSVGKAVSGKVEGTARGVSSSVTSFQAALLSAVAAFLKPSAEQSLQAMESLFQSSASAIVRVADAASRKGSRSLAAADQKVLDFYERLLAMMLSHFTTYHSWFILGFDHLHDEDDGLPEPLNENKQRNALARVCAMEYLRRSVERRDSAGSRSSLATRQAEQVTAL